jgi:hypothetical protein
MATAKTVTQTLTPRQQRLLRDTRESAEAALKMLDSYERDPAFARGNLYSVRTQLQQAGNAVGELIGHLDRE